MGHAFKVGVRGIAAVLLILAWSGCDGQLSTDLGRRPGAAPDLVDGGGGEGGSLTPPGGKPGSPPLSPVPGRDGGPPPLPPECSTERRSIQRVFFGTDNPSYVPLTPGQVKAIGSFRGCSGALITPTWVLSAKHCSIGTGSRFCLGHSATAEDTCFNVRQVKNNTGSDLALVELDQDATAAMPGVQPIPILTEPLDESWFGRTAEAAGYGRQEDGSSNEREFTAEPIVGFLDGHVQIDGEGERGVCNGDSGGPLMVIASDGTVRVAASLHYGDESCVGVDNYTRVDLRLGWVEGITGPTQVTGGSCGSVTTTGRCSGGSAMWCGSDDQLEVERCAAGQACGYDTAANGYRCVTEGTDPCQGYDEEGTCEGTVAKYCLSGTLRTVDCASCGESCLVDATQGGVVCQEDPCASLGYEGRCNGDVAEWCKEGEYKTKDCAAEGKSCGYVNSQLGYFCQ